jgi:hypothetical protein
MTIEELLKRDKTVFEKLEKMSPEHQGISIGSQSFLY